ncbi:site-2 protease family protein [Bacillus sp. 2205SS5-2]|uniref:site-2 protease family protein n=1 Tax=Bacillus sp. 2205SS5-2 TaxID=3109031 RepID=UPI003004AF4F
MDFLESILRFSLEELPFIVIALIVAFTVHEFAHAYTALKFGDDTAAKKGRVTLNPIQHLDPFGTILILIAGFGWARPVPVNRFNLRRPRLHSILVTAAGPLSNFIIAFISYGILFLLVNFGGSSEIMSFLVDLFNTMGYLNILLFVFNLLPFPPLDGYRIIEDLVSPRVRPTLVKYEQYGIVIFLIMVITPLDQYTIWPFLEIGISTVNNAFILFYSSFF